MTASISYDDGTGPRQYIGCGAVYSGAIVRGVARFDGERWLPLDGGLYLYNPNSGPESASAKAFAVYDPDGSGPQRSLLIVGGAFTAVDGQAISAAGVAAWDGSQWHDMSAGMLSYFGSSQLHVPNINALAVFDSGSGPKLYAAGQFELSVTSGSDTGAKSFGLGVWDGSAWTPIGNSGFVGTLDGDILDFAVFNDGTGNALYLSGNFPNGIRLARNTRNIAKWNGTTWSGVGAGLPNAMPFDMRVCDIDGDGPNPAKLFTMSASGLRSWNGAAWSTIGLPDGLTSIETPSMTVLNTPAGSSVVFSGAARPVVPARARLYRYDGSSISTFADPFDVPTSDIFAIGPAFLGTVNLNGNDRVFVSGDNVLGKLPELPVRGTILWDGNAWAPMFNFGGTANERPPTEFFQRVPAFYRVGQFDPDGAGPLPTSIYASGDFEYFQGQRYPIPAAKFDGTSWSPLVLPSGGVADRFFTINTPSGEAFYAVGRLFSSSGLFQLVNNEWISVGPEYGITPISELYSIDFGNGPQLYSVGFDVFPPTVFNGSDWEALGIGLEPAQPGDYWFPEGVATDMVYSAVHDDGSGPALFVAGAYENGPIFKWDGEAWSPANQGYEPFSQTCCDLVPWLFTHRGELYCWHDGLDSSIASPTLEDFDSVMYKWVAGTGWQQVLTVPAYPAHPPQFFIGTTDQSQTGRALFIKRGDVATTVVEFTGTEFVDAPEFGVFNNAPNSMVRAPHDPLNSVWFTNTIGVGGVFNQDTPASPGTISALSSAGIARWSCVTNACTADFNNHNGVTVDDIFDFLNAWFAVNSSADVNHANGVTVDDIFFFLEAWFQGC